MTISILKKALLNVNFILLNNTVHRLCIMWHQANIVGKQKNYCQYIVSEVAYLFTSN